MRVCAWIWWIWVREVAVRSRESNMTIVTGSLKNDGSLYELGGKAFAASSGIVSCNHKKATFNLWLNKI